MELRISSLVPEKFRPIWRDMRAFGHDEYWMVGGRGCAKSTEAALRVVTSLVEDPDANAVCYKKHYTELKDTVLAECQKAINRLGWGSLFTVTERPANIVFKPTGQRILFRGLDEADKSKGLTVTRGYIQVAWFEEYSQFAGQKEIDTVLQSIGRGGPKFQVLATYNPPETRSNWVNQEVAKLNPNRMVEHFTYLDIPPEWLGPVFFRLADRIKAENPLRYAHEYMGEVTGTGGEVFRNLEAVTLTDEEIANFRRKRWGMDFGQADPTVLVGTNYEQGEDVLTFFDEWGKPDAFLSEMYDAIAERNLLMTPIVGDEGGGGKGCIKELRARGVRRIVEAYKPAGSVAKGMRWYRERRRIRIDPRRCPNTWAEFSGYEYEQLRDGTYRNEYPDKDNHRIDAGRYANEDEIFADSRSRLLI